MKLTKKKAIKIAIELWTDLTETGEAIKRDWTGWEKYGHMTASCPFCEYGNRKDRHSGGGICFSCPYYQVFGYCTDGKAPYWKWDGAKTKTTRKKYASLFLEQLKQLK